MTSSVTSSVKRGGKACGPACVPLLNVMQTLELLLGKAEVAISLEYGSGLEAWGLSRSLTRNEEEAGERGSALEVWLKMERQVVAH